MIKPSKTKAEIRAELSRELEQYLESGGEIKDIPRGVSGNNTNNNLFSQATTFEPRQERTPVNEVVKEIEARKKPQKHSERRSRGPKKRLITDDFGEPIRWVWDD